MRIKSIIYIILCCFLMTQGVGAQTVRNISVSQKASYTDHISLKEDATDKDLMVKFVFDEAANTLTVSLISYRSLYVFRESVRYKPLIKGHTLRPDRLPYVVTYDPTEKYKLSSEFKQSITKPYKKFVFSRWADYEGLQPAPQEYAMINDFISQTYDIVNKRSQVVVTLHDVMLIDDVSKHPNKKRYEISFARDLNREYRITIERDPCFGLEEEIASAKLALESISKGYASIKSKYGSGVVNSESSLSVFNEMKGLMVNQFPHKDVQSPCPDVQQVWNEYNHIADSISTMTCHVSGGAGGAGGEGISAKVILNKTRQIDALVSRYLLSSDPIERRDIIQQIESIIKSTNASVSGQRAYSTEQQKALNLYHEAVRYYQRRCQ